MNPPDQDNPRALRKRSHEWIDARSLDLSRAIAELVRQDLSLLEKARENLARWRERHDPWPAALAEWEHILEANPPDRVLEILTEESEEGRRRRQSSPFAGILPESERRALFQRYEQIGT